MALRQDLMVALEIRPALPEDVSAAGEILADASAWLQGRGIAQWPARFSEEFLLGFVRRGELYVAGVGTTLVGTVTLQWADPPFWGDRQDAGFVHRLAVRRSHAGVGRSLLDWAEQAAVDHGRTFLCLDTLSSNVRLRRYYEDLGFREVREISGPADHPTDPVLGAWRAVLYEKGVGPGLPQSGTLR
jgi:ribosomal protein S18 acetylase RimI-like enzyme